MKMNELRAKAKELGLDMVHGETKEALKARIDKAMPVQEPEAPKNDELAIAKQSLEAKGVEFIVADDYWQANYSGKAESGNLKMTADEIIEAVNRAIFRTPRVMKIIGGGVIQG